MTHFDQREKAFEAKFAHDEELRFKMIVRRGRLFADWIAQQLGLGAEDAAAYVHRVTEALYQPGGQHDMVETALADLAAAGSALTRPEIAVAFDKFERIAKQEIAAEQERG
jgi:hypothetical protein